MLLHTLILAFVYFARMFGIFVIYPVFALMANQYAGATAIWTGMILGGYGLIQALLQIPMGRLSDIYGRKSILLLGLSLFACGSLLAYLSDDIVTLFLARLLQGTGAIAAVIQALVGDLFEEKKRALVMAIIGFSIGLSFMLALLISPPLAAMVGLRGLFLTSLAASCIAIMVVVIGIKEPQVKHIYIPTRSIGYWLKQKQKLHCDLGIFITHFAITAVFLVIPKALSDFNLPLAEHWKIYLLLFLASIPGVALLLWLERGKYQRLSVPIAAACILFAALGLALSAQLIVFFLMLWLFFIGFNTLEAVLPTRCLSGVDKSARGSVMGLFSCSQFLGMFAGGALGGILLYYVGESALFWLLTLLLAFIVIMSASDDAK